MISRDKAFPVQPFQVPRNKSIKVINLQGRITTSQIPAAVQEAARSPRGKRTPRSPRGAKLAEVVRSPQPKEEVKETVGEVLRGGSSAVRLRRGLHDLVSACPQCATPEEALPTLYDLLEAFQARCKNDFGMLDGDDFNDAIQYVFTPFGEPVERRRVTRLFNVLDAAQTDMADFKLLIVAFLKIMPLESAPLSGRVALLHKLYGDDMDSTGPHTPSILNWASEQEQEYIEYARQILERLDGSKQANMLTWEEVNMASKRAPLVLHALHRAFAYRPETTTQLDLLAKHAQTATASHTALMLAAMQGGGEKVSFDWAMLGAIWSALKARIARTKRTTLPRAEWVAEVTKQQGGSELPERKAVLETLFDIADPDGSGIVDARDCLAVLCRGMRTGEGPQSARQVSADIELRLDFFRSLYETPIGAAGPNGPSVAMDRLHYVKILERCLDEQKECLSAVHEGLQALRMQEDRLDPKAVADKAKAEPTFDVALAAIL